MMDYQLAIKCLNGETNDINRIVVARAVAVKALQEIQKYEAVGTPDECRAAVEKQKPKKPTLDYESYSARCPRCGKSICKLDAVHEVNCHCQICGQLVKYGGNDA